MTTVSECAACGGRGHVEMAPPMRELMMCRACKGTGRIEVRQRRNLADRCAKCGEGFSERDTIQFGVAGRMDHPDCVGDDRQRQEQEMNR